MQKSLNMPIRKTLLIFVLTSIENTGIPGSGVMGQTEAAVNLMKVAFNEPLKWENNKQA